MHHGIVLRVVLLVGFLCIEVLSGQGQEASGNAFSRLEPAVPTTLGGKPPSFRIGEAPWNFAADEEQRNAGQSSRPFISRTLHRFGKDQAEIYSAPFRRSNLKWDALFLAGTGTLISFDEQISRSLPTTQLDLSHNLSNGAIATLGVASGAIWLTGLKTGDPHAKETGELEIEALANTFTVYTLMQVVAGRQRPDEGTGEGRFLRSHSVNTSFPGGHAMFTFAMASVIAHEYPKRWVQILSYGAAATIGVTRFTGRSHFGSDIFAGSMLGYFIGTHIFHSRCKLGRSSACRTPE